MPVLTQTSVLAREADLTVAPSTTLNWGAPFHVDGASGITALSTPDGPLSTLVADTAISAGRRAALTLGTLAFLHFEAPNAAAARTVASSPRPTSRRRPSCEVS